MRWRAQCQTEFNEMYRNGSLPIAQIPYTPTKEASKKKSADADGGEEEEEDEDEDEENGTARVPETNEQAIVRIIDVVVKFIAVRSKLHRNDPSKSASAPKGGGGGSSSSSSSSKQKKTGGGSSAPTKKQQSTPTEGTMTDVDIPPLAPLSSHPHSKEWAEALRIASSENLVASLRYQVDQFQILLPGDTLEKKAQYAQSSYEAARPQSKNLHLFRALVSCLERVEILLQRIESERQLRSKQAQEKENKQDENDAEGTATVAAAAAALAAPAAPAAAVAAVAPLGDHIKN